MTDTHGVPSVNTGAFAVSPELAAGAYQQISGLQDTVGEMVREARVLGRTVPLGDGYAGEVGEFMARYGLGGPGSAADALIAFGQELETVRTNISRALKRYSDADDDARDGVDCSGG